MKKYEGYVIQDDGCRMSEDAMKFCRYFRSYLSRNLKPHNIKTAKFHAGHYFVSGFVERDGKVLYINYDIPRYGRPISIRKTGAHEGVLVRRTDEVGDYGTRNSNHFTSLEDLPAYIIRNIDREGGIWQ